MSPASDVVLAWLAPGKGELEQLVEPQREFWRHRRGDWVLLPDVPESGGWSIVAADAEGLRRGREVLNAFCGPSIARVQPNHEFANSDLTNSATQMAQVEIIDPERFLSSVARLIVVRSGEPATQRFAPRPLALLIRDLRLAISSGASTRAESLLEELRRQGSLTTENLDFLEAELLGGFGRWRELRDREWFANLAQRRRPRAVTEFLLEAIWQIDLGGSEGIAAGEALERLALLPHDLLSIFDEVDDPVLPGASRAVQLKRHQREVGRVMVEPTSLESIRDDAPHLELSTSRTIEDDVASAPPVRERILERRAIDLVEDARRNPDDPQKLETAIRAVPDEIETTTRIELALQLQLLIDGLGREQLPTTPTFLWSLGQVESLAAHACGGWLEWCKRVADRQVWAEAAQTLRDGATRWSLDDLNSSANSQAAGSFLFEGLEGPNADAVHMSLDLLCEASAQLVSSAPAQYFVEAIFVILASSTVSEAMTDAILGLEQAALRSGPTAERYEWLLTALEGSEVFDLRVHIPLALDVLDDLAFYACPSPDRRLQIAHRTYAAFVGHASHGHLAPDLRALADGLFSELGLDVPPLWTALTPEGAVEGSGKDPENPWSALDGKTVFLYSLLDGIAARFEQRLRQLCPGVTVTHSEDSVATPRLRSAVASADFVIVDTWHAKHAATLAIDDECPKGRQILPEGKGCASFVSALAKALADYALPVS